jgi:hypothetical protein
VLDRRGHPLSQAKKKLEGQSVRIVLSKGMVGANLTEVQPGKTLIDALRPQASDATAVSPKKTKSRRKKAS